MLLIRSIPERQSKKNPGPEDGPVAPMGADQKHPKFPEHPYDPFGLDASGAQRKRATPIRRIAC
jgi:hypothetical protein